MKAVILAGGKGTRGKPYTDYFPKAMIPINGVPMIQYIVKYLDSFSFVKEIIIISDFKALGAQIKNHLDGQKLSKKITLVQDSQSGTGGDLIHASNFLKNTNEFVLWFVDNFCAIDLSAMKKQFKKSKTLACIATRTKRKEETGFAKISNGKIVDFQEKPVLKLPLSECLGVYMLDKKILELIEKKHKKEVNLSYDILEGLAKQSSVSAYDIGNREWLDVESPVIVDRNQKSVSKIIKQMGF